MLLMDYFLPNTVNKLRSKSINKKCVQKSIWTAVVILGIMYFEVQS